MGKEVVLKFQRGDEKKSSVIYRQADQVPEGRQGMALYIGREAVLAELGYPAEMTITFAVVE